MNRIEEHASPALALRRLRRLLALVVLLLAEVVVVLLALLALLVPQTRIGSLLALLAEVVPLFAEVVVRAVADAEVVVVVVVVAEVVVVVVVVVAEVILLADLAAQQIVLVVVLVVVVLLDVVAARAIGRIDNERSVSGWARRGGRVLLAARATRSRIAARACAPACVRASAGARRVRIKAVEIAELWEHVKDSTAVVVHLGDGAVEEVEVAQHRERLQRLQRVQRPEAIAGQAQLGEKE
jgi:hypothetical protein